MSREQLPALFARESRHYEYTHVCISVHRTPLLRSRPRIEGQNRDTSHTYLYTVHRRRPVDMMSRVPLRGVESAPGVLWVASASASSSRTIESLCCLLLESTTFASPEDSRRRTRGRLDVLLTHSPCLSVYPYAASQTESICRT
jgi:hypothetical protein